MQSQYPQDEKTNSRKPTFFNNFVQEPKSNEQHDDKKNSIQIIKKSSSVDSFEAVKDGYDLKQSSSGLLPIQTVPKAMSTGIEAISQTDLPRLVPLTMANIADMLSCVIAVRTNVVDNTDAKKIKHWESLENIDKQPKTKQFSQKSFNYPSSLQGSLLYKTQHSRRNPDGSKIILDKKDPINNPIQSPIFGVVEFTMSIADLLLDIHFGNVKVISINNNYISFEIIEQQKVLALQNEKMIYSLPLQANTLVTSKKETLYAKHCEKYSVNHQFEEKLLNILKNLITTAADNKSQASPVGSLTLDDIKPTLYHRSPVTVSHHTHDNKKTSPEVEVLKVHGRAGSMIGSDVDSLVMTTNRKVPTLAKWKYDTSTQDGCNEMDFAVGTLLDYYLSDKHSNNTLVRVFISEYVLPYLENYSYEIYCDPRERAEAVNLKSSIGQLKARFLSEKPLDQKDLQSLAKLMRLSISIGTDFGVDVPNAVICCCFMNVFYKKALRQYFPDIDDESWETLSNDMTAHILQHGSDASYDKFGSKVSKGSIDSAIWAYGGDNKEITTRNNAINFFEEQFSKITYTEDNDTRKQHLNYIASCGHFALSKNTEAAAYLLNNLQYLESQVFQISKRYVNGQQEAHIVLNILRNIQILGEGSLPTLTPRRSRPSTAGSQHHLQYFGHNFNQNTLAIPGSIADESDVKSSAKDNLLDTTFTTSQQQDQKYHSHSQDNINTAFVQAVNKTKNVKPTHIAMAIDVFAESLKNILPEQATLFRQETLREFNLDDKIASYYSRPSTALSVETDSNPHSSASINAAQSSSTFLQCLAALADCCGYNLYTDLREESPRNYTNNP